VLVPYPELRDGGAEELARWEGLDVFLDCGAWSVSTGAIKPIDVQEYVGWLQATQFPFAAVASLDVIGDAHRTESNYNAMLAAGVDAIPTWHSGSSSEALRRISQARYFAVGGLASRKGIGADKTLRSVAPFAAGKNVHLFGCIGAKALLGFRPYSADSTGYIVGAKLGEVYTLTKWPRAVRNFDVTKRASQFDRHQVMSVVSEMRNFGSSWSELDKSFEARIRYNARVLLEYERRLNQVFDKVAA
jgi:hypothetical protein